MSSEEKSGFLLHTYIRPRQKQAWVYGTGKLENGETFGFVDRRTRPTCFILSREMRRAEDALAGMNLSWNRFQGTTMDGEAVLQIEADSIETIKRLVAALAQIGVTTYEGDLPLPRRYLIDHNIYGPISLKGDWQKGREVDWIIFDPEIEPGTWEPDLSILSIDIETSREADRVTAISCIGAGPLPKNVMEVVLVLGEPLPGDPPHLMTLSSEKKLLLHFSGLIQNADPDIITGWNVVDFDLKTLKERYQANGIPFTIGRSRDRCYYLEGSAWGGSRAVIYGRQVVDAMHFVRNTVTSFEDYRLETVAQTVLGRGKLIEGDEQADKITKIETAYREDRALFAEYCLEDARLVLDILDKMDLIQLSLRRCMLTGLPLENAWGSVAAFEFLYLVELHRRQMVASPVGKEAEISEQAPGGYVLEPVVGVHNRILVFDFKSLYPSIIRTFNIDPLALVTARSLPDQDVVTTINGTRFDRKRGILPGLLDIFFERRSQARKEGNALASYTYKIVMNSFYGVLGTPACRFASGRLAGAITHTGHHLMKWCRDFFHEKGWTVLYGDTDSLFVDAHLPADIPDSEMMRKGDEICRLVNRELADYLQREFGIDSLLELEFEKLYRKLLLPPSRGNGKRGRAKGYAGLLISGEKEELQIVGMEAVRRDWTELSHQFQRELLTLLFADTPASEMERFIQELIEQVRAGKKDDTLVYRKSLRKPVEAYTKTTPPHVKAALLLPNPSGIIHYVMTLAGPQPVGYRNSPMDYNHYIDKQIKPIVETVAHVSNINIQAAFDGGQLSF